MMMLRHEWNHYVPTVGTIGLTKRFLQADGRKSDIPYYAEDGNGQFRKGIPDQKKPLPLDGLATISDPEELVFIVEGQKTQRAASGLGLQAVTWIGGSQNVKNCDWSSLKHVKTAVIFPDNDQPGMKAAHDIYEQLSVLNPDIEIAWVRLPNLPQSGDLCDWIKEKLPHWDEYSSLENHAERDRLRDELMTAIEEGLQEISLPIDGGAEPISMDSNPQDWPEPDAIEADLLPVQELDPSILPDGLRDWITDTAHGMHTQLSFVATGVMVLAGTLIGTRCRVRPKTHASWAVIPNLWGAIVANPGKLKTPTLAAVLSPLERLEAQATVRYQEDLKWHTADVADFESKNKSLKNALDKINKIHL